MKTCANCESRVIPRPDGTCPSCRRSTDVKSEESAQAPAASPAKPALARGPMAGALIGVVVAAVATNLSRSGHVDSMTLVTALAALVGGVLGVLGVRAALAAWRRR